MKNSNVNKFFISRLILEEVGNLKFVFEGAASFKI